MVRAYGGKVFSLSWCVPQKTVVSLLKLLSFHYNISLPLQATGDNSELLFSCGPAGEIV